MEKLFVSLKIASMLKEKGFDETCFGFYENNTLDPNCPKLIIDFNNMPLSEEQSKRPNMYKTEWRNSTCPQWVVSAPTREQVVSWFEKTHEIWLTVRRQYFYGGGVEYNDFVYLKGQNEHLDITLGNEFDTYEEAMDSAIRNGIKLI